MQTQMFTIFSSNDSAVIEKIAELKFCILNSIKGSMLSITYEKKNFFLPWRCPIRPFSSSIKPFIRHLSLLEIGSNV